MDAVRFAVEGSLSVPENTKDFNDTDNSKAGKCVLHVMLVGVSVGRTRRIAAAPPPPPRFEMSILLSNVVQASTRSLHSTVAWCGLGIKQIGCPGGGELMAES